MIQSKEFRAALSITGIMKMGDWCHYSEMTIVPEKVVVILLQQSLFR